MTRGTCATFATLAAAVLAIGMSGTAASANLLVNGNFDAGGGSFTGWTPFANAFTSTAAAQSQPASMKMFGNFTGGYNASGAFQTFPAVPGQKYMMDAASFMLSTDALTTAGGNQAFIKIVFKDAGGNELPGDRATGIGTLDQVVVDGNTPTDTWIDNPALFATAPAGAVTVSPYVLFLQPPGFAGGAAYVDDVVFDLAPIPEPASMSLAGLGAAARLGRRRRR